MHPNDLYASICFLFDEVRQRNYDCLLAMGSLKDIVNDNTRMRKAFVRACYDKSGSIYITLDNTLKVTFSEVPFLIAKLLHSYIEVDHTYHDNAWFVVKGAAATDLCAWMYDDEEMTCDLSKSKIVNRLMGTGLQFKCVLRSPDARMPQKANASDAGFDLWIISKDTEFDNGTVLYDTGVAIQPPHGYYFDLVARSSIVKTGYMLANNIGIIDAGYQGNIKVPLVKVCASAPDIELPMKIAQLIPRRTYMMDPVQVLAFDQGTARGQGGFGSSSSKMTPISRFI